MDVLGRRRWWSVLGGVLAVGFFGGMTDAACAAPPMVSFDVAQTVSCRVVESPACLQEKPGLHVVEVLLDVSARLTAGKESDLKYITYEIHSPGGKLKVVGFTPMTTLASDAADGVVTVEEHEAPAQLNIEYAGSQAKLQTPLKTPVDKKVTTRKVAPRTLLISSGTFDRAHGVYFTFYPSPHDSLQRAQPLVCYFDAPEGFRADYVQVSCKAVAHDRTLGHSDDTEVPAGSARFQVGLYLDGDAEARQAADELARSQQQLSRALVAYRGAVAKQKPESSSPSDMFKGVWKLVKGDPGSRTSGQPSFADQGPSPRTQVTAFKPVLLEGQPAEPAPLQVQVAQAQRAVLSAQRTIRLLNDGTAGSMR